VTAPDPRKKDHLASAHGPRVRAATDEERSPARVAFFVVSIAVLIVGGWYLVNGLADTSKMEDCEMAGRRNCVPPIDTSKVGH
jgi:hypothetical protein